MKVTTNHEGARSGRSWWSREKAAGGCALLTGGFKDAEGLPSASPGQERAQHSAQARVRLEAPHTARPAGAPGPEGQERGTHLRLELPQLERHSGSNCKPVPTLRLRGCAGVPGARGVTDGRQRCYTPVLASDARTQCAQWLWETAGAGGCVTFGRETVQAMETTRA